MKYGHVLHAIYETPWAIQPEMLQTILSVMHERAGGITPTIEEIRARIAAAHDGDEPSAAAGQERASPGAIAVLRVYGVISQRVTLMTELSGGTSTELLAKQFRQAMADQTVGAIVLDVSSPGGGVYGVQELADEIFRARGGKPIVAVANSLAASAAYWIATAADELVVTPSGEVGSVGVFAAHTDFSKQDEMAGVKTTLISAGKYKVEGNEFEPLDDEALSFIQSRINEYYDAFTSAVARHRGVKQSEVRDGYGEGRVLGAKQAVSLGMADRVDTFDNVLASVAKRLSTSRTRAEADDREWELTRAGTPAHS